MKEKVNEINDESQLLRNIELYFDCQLTDEEEMELRRQLAHTSLSHPAVEEARAVMGFTTIRYRSLANVEVTASRGRLRGIRNMIAGVAASVALMVTAGVAVIQNFASNSSGDCIAYVNGRRITDEEDVWEIATQDAEELEKAFDECLEGTADDIEALGSIMENIEMNPDLSDLI